MRVIYRSTLFLMLATLIAAGAFAGGGQEEAEAPPESSVPERPPTAEAEEPSAESDAASTAMDPATVEILTDLGLVAFDSPIPFEDFIVPALGGGEIALSDHLGKVVFLNFWATWCPPCREEMPSMQLLYEELADEGLEILAVDVQESEATVQEFVAEFGFTFPILLDSDGRVALRYGIRAFPTTYIIDRKGFVLGGRPGYHDWSAPSMIEGFRKLLEQ